MAAFLLSFGACPDEKGPLRFLPSGLTRAKDAAFLRLREADGFYFAARPHTLSVWKFTLVPNKTF